MTTPFAIVSAVEQPLLASKAELLRLCRQVELAALHDPPPLAVATLQDERFVTARTREVYAALAAAGAPGTLFAAGLQAWVAPGVRGVDLDEEDPLVDEWTVVLPSPGSPFVFASTDVRGPHEQDMERSFRYAVSRDPAVVSACAEALLAAV